MGKCIDRPTDVVCLFLWIMMILSCINRSPNVAQLLLVSRRKPDMLLNLCRCCPDLWPDQIRLHSSLPGSVTLELQQFGLSASPLQSSGSRISRKYVTFTVLGFGRPSPFCPQPKWRLWFRRICICVRWLLQWISHCGKSHNSCALPSLPQTLETSLSFELNFTSWKLVYHLPPHALR